MHLPMALVCRMNAQSTADTRIHRQRALFTCQVALTTAGYWINIWGDYEKGATNYEDLEQPLTHCVFIPLGVRCISRDNNQLQQGLLHPLKIRICMIRATSTPTEKCESIVIQTCTCKAAQAHTCPEMLKHPDDEDQWPNTGMPELQCGHT